MATFLLLQINPIYLWLCITFAFYFTTILHQLLHTNFTHYSAVLAEWNLDKQDSKNWDPWPQGIYYQNVVNLIQNVLWNNGNLDISKNSDFCQFPVIFAKFLMTSHQFHFGTKYKESEIRNLTEIDMVFDC